jgi:hypothetical protein
VSGKTTQGRFDIGAEADAAIRPALLHIPAIHTTGTAEIAGRRGPAMPFKALARS